MAVTEYIVQNISDVTNPPGQSYTIAGVVIDAGTSRNLSEDGVTLEEVARDPTLTAGLLAGDLTGPPQTYWVDQADNGTTMVPGGVYYVSPSTSAPFTLVLPPAVATSQVYIVPIRIFNPSVHTVTLVLVGADTMSPAGSLSVAQDEHREFWSVRDPSSGAWGFMAIT